MRHPFPATIVSTCLFFGSLCSLSGQMDNILDELSDNLRMASADNRFRAALSGTLDLEAYAFEGAPPALLRTRKETLLQPRATLFLDMQAGTRVYGFIQVRVDRGFDPADHPAELRLDEFAFRFTPWSDGRLNLQAGQFATVVGRWVTRHLSWQNPFITAPLIYENPTRLSDLRPPPSPDYLAYPSGRQGYYYNPVIWGPSYATGFAASGKAGSLEWAVELKNASLMSRPELWPIEDRQFDAPTVSARLAWRPDPRWNVGLSGSTGSFAGESAAFADRHAYEQELVMLDVSYAYRHLQIWVEVARSTFRLPGFANDLETFAWFVEGKLKLTPRLSVAARLNEQRFSSYSAYGESIGSWGTDRRRLDFALTWRFNAYSQIQVQVDRYWDDDPGEDRSVMSARLTLRF